MEGLAEAPHAGAGAWGLTCRRGQGRWTSEKWLENRESSLRWSHQFRECGAIAFVPREGMSLIIWNKL